MAKSLDEAVSGPRRQLMIGCLLLAASSPMSFAYARGRRGTRNELRSLRSGLGAVNGQSVFLLLAGIRPAAAISIYDWEQKHIARLLATYGLVSAQLGRDPNEFDVGYYLVAPRGRLNRLKVAQPTARVPLTWRQIVSATGIPSCCVNHTAAEPLLSPTEGMRVPWQLNTLRMGGDISLLSHSPCSWTCRRSLDQANRDFEAIYEADRHEAVALSHALCGSYTMRNGSTKRDPQSVTIHFA